jgi:hypothetical protein
MSNISREEELNKAAEAGRLEDDPTSTWLTVEDKPLSFAFTYERSNFIELLLQHYIGMYEQCYYSGLIPLTPTTASSGDDVHVPEFNAARSEVANSI